ncbi:MAG: Maf family nucleotide pyrophosphatase [Perlabentimonas sp.]
MLLHNSLKGLKLVLASKSPRRQHLLAELGVPFEVRLNGEVDESYPPDLPHTEIPVYLAQKKAKPLLKTLAENEVLITSDTIVWCSEQVLGKPTDRSDAIAILQELSGKRHDVITGVSLIFKGNEHSFAATTQVFFKELSQEEIIYYVDKYKPYDKAGAYGIQEWIGYVGVERIDGSYFNVMGLPVQRLYTELQSFIQKLESPKTNRQPTTDN